MIKTCIEWILFCVCSMSHFSNSSQLYACHCRTPWLDAIVERMMSLWITVGYIVIHDAINIDIDGVKICKLRAVNLFSSAKEIYAKRSRHASKPKFKKPNLLQSGHLGVGGRPLCKLCSNVTAQNEKLNWHFYKNQNWIDILVKVLPKFAIKRAIHSANLIWCR